MFLRDTTATTGSSAPDIHTITSVVLGSPHLWLMNLAALPLLVASILNLSASCCDGRCCLTTCTTEAMFGTCTLLEGWNMSLHQQLPGPQSWPTRMLRGAHQQSMPDAIPVINPESFVSFSALYTLTSVLTNNLSPRNTLIGHQAPALKPQFLLTSHWHLWAWAMPHGTRYESMARYKTNGAVGCCAPCYCAEQTAGTVLHHA